MGKASVRTKWTAKLLFEIILEGRLGPFQVILSRPELAWTSRAQSVPDRPEITRQSIQQTI